MHIGTNIYQKGKKHWEPIQLRVYPDLVWQSFLSWSNMLADISEIVKIKFFIVVCLSLVMPNSLWPHEGPHKTFCPWDFPGKNIKWGSYFLLCGRSFPLMGQTHVFCTAGWLFNTGANQRSLFICKLKRKEKKQIQVYLYFLRPWRLRILEQITMGEWERAMGNVKQSEKEWGRVTLPWLCKPYHILKWN